MRLILTAILMAIAICAIAEDVEHLSLLRYHYDTPSDFEWMEANQLRFQIEAGRVGDYIDIAVRPSEVAEIMAAGSHVELIAEKAHEHYAAQMETRGDRDLWGYFHTYSEAIAHMDSLHMLYPDIVSEKWSIGQGHNGYHLYVYKISDYPEIDEPGEPEVLFDGLHHANEIMGLEVVLMLSDYLAEEYYAGNTEIMDLVNGNDIYMIPFVNPDGLVYNEETYPGGGATWRKNRRNNGSSYGVDLNRNYGYEWGCSWGSSGTPSDPTYRGPSAESEPEVQAMTAFIDSREFIVHQSYHSSGNMTLIPWGYTTNPTPDDALFMDIAAVMCSENGYAFGQPGEILYDVCGGTFDWTYGDVEFHEKIYSFSNELGSSQWPSQSQRQIIFDDNLMPALYLIEVAAGLRSVSFDHAQLPFTADYLSSYEVEATAYGYGGAAIDESTVKLFYRLDGGLFTELPMSAAGGGVFTASIPPQGQGTAIGYYLYAEDVDGNSGVHPFGAPETLNYFETGESFAHPMEADRGWTKGAEDDDASTGIWVRVDPIGTNCQPEDDHSADGTDCWITGQHQAGQSDGYNDVDSGKTTLFSPVYDMTGAESLTFGYWKWYSNDQGSDPGNDYWDVDLANDGDWAVLEHDNVSTNAWVEKNYDFFDHFGTPGMVQLRFVASDEGSGSLVEGGVDDFFIAGVFDATGVDDGATLPFRVGLAQNAPNPFNPKTDISFALTRTGPVSLKVYDVAGRLLAVLVDDVLEAGEHAATWNGRDMEGRAQSSGVYFYQLQAEGKVMAKRMVILK